MKIKPMIKKIGNNWHCFTWLINGVGKTPKEAYDQCAYKWRSNRLETVNDRQK